MPAPRRIHRLALGLTLVLVWVSAPLSGQETPGPTAEQQERIKQLIKQLNADDFEQRQQAQLELEKIGLPALEALRQAKKDRQPETARRAAEIVDRLEDLLKAGAKLPGKKVNLKLKDVPVADA